MGLWVGQGYPVWLGHMSVSLPVMSHQDVYLIQL